MKTLIRLALAVVTALSLAPALRAEDGKPLVIGGVRLFLIRGGDTLNGRDMSIDARIDHVQDVFAKHLGGKYAKFTWKKFGERVHIYLNNDFVLACTPADAKATAHKTAEKLAPIWLEGLKKAFNETHVGPGGGAS
jgi:hypothetical protein